MTRFGFVLVVAICTLAAACDDSPTAPSGTPQNFSAILSPANEVPPVANAESSGRGAAQIRFQVVRDSAGNVTGGSATMYFQLTGLPAGTVLRGAHIHSAVAGVNGPIVVDTGVSPTNTLTLTGGVNEFTFTVDVNAATLSAILVNPSAYYFNVHSPTNPGGLARGQLVPIG